jgi:Glu-tRNA(Gln) amidotransferase subunit E-like FAD-binding protein
MYPDTDTPPIPIPDDLVAEVRSRLGEAPWVRKVRYEQLGLGARMAQVLSVAPWADLFDEVSPAEGEPARRLAAALEKRVPYHARKSRGSKPRRAREVPDASRLSPLVRALEKGEIRPEALTWAVDELLADPNRSPEEVLEKFRPRTEDKENLDSVLTDVAARVQASTWRSPQSGVRWAAGAVLREFFGRVSPSEVRRRLDALLDSGPKDRIEEGRQ